MCVGLGTSTRSFLGEPGQEGGLVQLCGDTWTQSLRGLCAMPVSSLQGNESCSGSKSQSVGVLGLVTQQELPEGDLVVLVKKKHLFFSKFYTAPPKVAFLIKQTQKGYLGSYLTASEQTIASQHGRSDHAVNGKSTLGFSHPGKQL